jgi:hypothetical protein
VRLGLEPDAHAGSADSHQRALGGGGDTHAVAGRHGHGDPGGPHADAGADAERRRDQRRRV